MAVQLWGLEITVYSSSTNDRFVSGFPTAPVENDSGAIFGQDYDWTGVAWTSGFVQKGYAFVSPRHYLAARHFGGGTTIVVLDQTDTLQSENQQSFENTLFGEILNSNSNGDISIGTLSSSLTNIKRYGLLDLHTNSTSNSESNYGGLPVLIYGHGGDETSSTRVGQTEIAPDPFGDASVKVSGQQSRFLTTRSDIQLVTNDSGSPAFYGWTNPNGQAELALLGNHAAISDNYNFHNFFCTLEVFASLNGFMNDDGFALRLVGDPSGNTWQGSSSTDIELNEAWGLGSSGPGNSGSSTDATNDEYVLFDPSAASSFSIDVSTNYNLRGLYFKSSNTGGVFNFSGGATLTIGRGGITNYDSDTQSFSNNLALGAPQYWSIEGGAISLVNLNNNGYLLEVGGSGSVSVSGNISGSGGLALSEGVLTLSSNSSYTGPTWIHGGTLFADGNISSSSSLTVGSFGQLAGTGTTPNLIGPGTISPGKSPGILTTASIGPSSGMDFNFEFTSAGEPDFSNATASINDVLRITGTTPFSNSMTSSNRIRLFLNTGGISAGDVIEGGFFTDQTSDFLAFIENADFELYVADAGGSVSFGGLNYSLYSGTLEISVSTEAQNADFGSGTLSGRIMRLTATAAIPDAPTNASASAVSTTAIDLSWTDNSSNEDGFRIERSPTGVNFPVELGPDTSSYNDIGLTANTGYTYRITAYNLTGDSASVEISGSTFSKIEDWRLTYFGTTANSGDAADDNDFDLDSTVNIIEFATGSDPTAFTSNPLNIASLGIDGQFSFNWRIDNGYDFAIGYSSDLNAGFTYYSSSDLDSGDSTLSPQLEYIGSSGVDENGIETRTYGLREEVSDLHVFLRLQVN